MYSSLGCRGTALISQDVLCEVRRTLPGEGTYLLLPRLALSTVESDASELSEMRILIVPRIGMPNTRSRSKLFQQYARDVTLSEL
jgi:hypothetical protein